MSRTSELHSQIASIVEVLANSAVAEICKAVEDGYAVVNLEMSRSLKENECLRRRVRLLELQVSRYRAEQRLKSPAEGTITNRGFPGVRLQRHGRDTPTGFGLQNRPRSVNRFSVSQTQHKTPSTDLDQDPNQEVVTTTKAEPTEPEEDSDLVIVKVEGSISIKDPNISNTASGATTHTSDSQAQTSSHMEVSESQTFSSIQAEPLPPAHCHQTENPEKSMDVIVIDGDGGKSQPLSPNAYIEKGWLSLQTPHCSTASTLNEAAGTSSGGEASSMTSIASTEQQTFNVQPTFRNQLFHTLNPRQNVAQFSALTDQSANTNQEPSQGNFRVRTLAKAYQGMRLLSCSKCPMRFSQEADLAKHVEAHKNRKFVCGLCGKGFVSKSNLDVHQNVHTGEKPFKCAICSSSFTNPSNLRRHMKLQHQLLKK